MRSVLSVGLWWLAGVTALVVASCDGPQERNTLFVERAAASGIDFRNDLPENEDQNIVDYLYFYNGAGVAVADFNADSLEDIYFVRNTGPNELYWNKGNFQFEKASSGAGVDGLADFQTGVTVVDINADGYPDLYVSAVNYLDWSGHNEFYLNQGDGTFAEVSAELGLDFEGYGQQAVFFDVDNDGDQDVYVLRHSVHPSGAFNNASQRGVRDDMAGDVFLLNVGSREEPVFKDESATYQILGSQIGYGLSVLAADFNGDGFQDLFVANDFHENDYLYLNDRGQRFVLSTDRSFQTNSKFTMGSDAADFNGDGTLDLFTLDMKPWDEVERKNAMGPEPFPIHKYKRNQGYVEQFPKNSLHLMRGNIPVQNGPVVPVFEDVAPILAVESSDWSWGVLMQDFDGDGAKDIFITNGIKRRPNDLDYIQFLSGGGGGAALDRQIYEKMPFGAVSNRAFSRAAGQSTLREVSAHWGLDYVGTSNGSAVADFNNDGRWDLVVNNLDAPALLYENVLGAPTTTVDFGGFPASYAKRLGAPRQWTSGTRSWLSHSTTRIDADHFGGSILVEWPGATTPEIYTLIPGETNFLRPGTGTPLELPYTPKPATVSQQPDTLPFGHTEDAFTSFASTPLLIEGIDEAGPAGQWFNGSLFVGASFRNPPFWATPTPTGWDTTWILADQSYEDVDAQIITLGNGQSALAVVTGSGQMPRDNFRQRDRIYGGANVPSYELSELGTNASCAAVLDINGDGIDDLFVGERAVWNDYGAPPEHALYLGTPSGELKRETPVWAAQLGMITDAIAADVVGDSRKELLIATDWGPIYLLQFKSALPTVTPIAPEGWWRHLNVQDVDGDGDLDILAGGMGENHGIHVAPGEPIELYIKDLDNNKNRDFLYSYYNQGIKYPLFGRDDLIKESVKYRKKYLKNREYSGLPFDKMFGSDLEGAQHLSVQQTASMWIENKHGTFKPRKLPQEAQLGPIYASYPISGGWRVGGGADAVHTTIGTQESSCGVQLVWNGDNVHAQPTPEILRGSVRQFLPFEGGVVVLMNDGPALLLDGK